MILSIIFDTEYMGVSERNKWFLKSVSNARKEETIIVTHEYMYDHLDEIVDGCAERFYKEFEMDHVSADEIRNMDICYVPDSIFNDFCENNSSRSAALLNLFDNRCESLEKYIVEYVDKILESKGKSLSCIMNCLHTFASVKYLSEHYNVPLIPYVFSCIRKVHGYAQTLYMAHFDKDLFNSPAAKEMYNNFNEDCFDFPILSKKEILALVGKKQNFVLLPLLNQAGTYEMGIVGEGFHITPEIYAKEPITDDDLHYECKKYYSSDCITTRLHPMQLDQFGIGRKHMKNDPAAFVLSCKRVATVQSQMIIKAAMWNRVPCVLGDALPYAFLFTRDFTSTSPLSDCDLNFILFCYFIPDSCMFSSEYWSWRETNPSLREIINRHIDAILSDLNIDKSILFSANRFVDILKYRGCSESEISAITKTHVDKINYTYPSSRVDVISQSGKAYSKYCLNTINENGLFVSEFTIPKDAKSIKLIPQNDVDGFVKLHKVQLDGAEKDIDKERIYWPKGMAKCALDNLDFNNDDRNLRIEWDVITIEEIYK